VRPPGLPLDEAVAGAVRLQRKLGLSVVTDGELRRVGPLSVVVDAVGGFRGTTAVDELKPHRTLVADDVAALATMTKVPAKATLPAPSYVAERAFDPSAGSPFGSARELGEALAAIYRDEIADLFTRGVRYIQLSHPSSGSGLSLEDAVAVDSLAVAIDDKPVDARIAVAVGALADPRVFEIPVDRFLLPFATGSDAELDLLRAVPEGRDVCLGIVDPAAVALEEVGAILNRIDRAAEVKDVEDLAVSPSAGFARDGDPEAQRAALVHVETIARMVWGNEL
jgi:5-methyltetrahydropteroyltriglutamate--homocysteine methyltransferase